MQRSPTVGISDGWAFSDGWAPGGDASSWGRCSVALEGSGTPHGGAGPVRGVEPPRRAGAGASGATARPLGGSRRPWRISDGWGWISDGWAGFRRVGVRGLQEAERHVRFFSNLDKGLAEVMPRPDIEKAETFNIAFVRGVASSAAHPNRRNFRRLTGFPTVGPPGRDASGLGAL